MRTFYKPSYTNRYRGFGDAATHQIMNASVSAGAQTAAAIALMAGGPAGPAIAGMIEAGNAIYQLLSAAFSGCGQTCVLATNIVNQLEPLLEQNLNSYLSAPVHYQSLQTQALATFDYTWQKVLLGCTNASLGQAGVNCIADRQQGACHYHTSPGGWSNGVYTAPGPNESGSACWNWFIGYRDPIANDPTVVADPSPVDPIVQALTGSTSGGTAAASGGSTLLPLAIAGGLILLAANL